MAFKKLPGVVRCAPDVADRVKREHPDALVIVDSDRASGNVLIETPRVFCGCVICGARGELERHGPAAPPGWRAIFCLHWPPGTDVGPLVLRICDRCRRLIGGNDPPIVGDVNSPNFYPKGT